MKTIVKYDWLIIFGSFEIELYRKPKLFKEEKNCVFLMRIRDNDHNIHSTHE